MTAERWERALVFEQSGETPETAYRAALQEMMEQAATLLGYRVVDPERDVRLSPRIAKMLSQWDLAATALRLEDELRTAQREATSLREYNARLEARLRSYAERDWPAMTKATDNTLRERLANMTESCERQERELGLLRAKLARLETLEAAVVKDIEQQLQPPEPDWSGVDGY